MSSISSKLVYPLFTAGEGPKDYLKIAIATESGRGRYQFFGQEGSKQSLRVGAKETQSVMYLGIPPQLNVKYGMQYNNIELGAVGGTALEMLNDLAGGASSESLGAKLAEGSQKALPELVLGMSTGLINQAISAGGFAGGVTPSSAAALTTGSTLNPFREITFQGVQYRQHAFTMKMVAKSKDEAEVIKKIVNNLRYYMHPTLSNRNASGQNFGGIGDANNRWLGVPSYFDLSFVRFGNQQQVGRVKLNNGDRLANIYQPGSCVLAGLNINFTPDGQFITGVGTDWVLAVTIQMNFRETVMLHRKALEDLGEVTSDTI